ncbi:MAG: hypothetical protein JNM24_15060 [Bdellovibrionaceae bacterium]|nr:hypothetical protein [Pseudobdellovibrionaceae bacterium]
MKNAAENIKNYLKFTHHVLGVSHIFRSVSSSAEATLDTEKKKIFNFYSWPENRAWTEFSFTHQANETGRFQNIFIFFSNEMSFEIKMREQSEMLSKMNQALGGTDYKLLLGWLSPNTEREFFENMARWKTPVRIVFFRDELSTEETIYTSGPHKVLETLSPLGDPNDQQRKRFVWNDFKRLLALS